VCHWERDTYEKERKRRKAHQATNYQESHILPKRERDASHQLETSASFPFPSLHPSSAFLHAHHIRMPNFAMPDAASPSARQSLSFSLYHLPHIAVEPLHRSDVVLSEHAVAHWRLVLSRPTHASSPVVDIHQ